MSTDKPAKKPRSTKTKADLEAKIAELEAKLNAVAAQASKPAETRPSPPPAPKPQVEQRPPPPPAPKPTAPKPESTQTSSSTQKEEVAPAYSTTSSSGYTGNRYYATRQRLAYHPPDKQYTGQVTVQVSRPAPAPEPEPTMVEPEPQKKKEEPRRIEPPAPTVKYTGENYYRTRQRLAYHPADKQFIQTVAIKFEEAPTVAQVESTTSSQSSSQKRSRDEELAAYEKEYLERMQQRKAEEAKPAPAPSTAKPHGTMPSGWKPS